MPLYLGRSVFCEELGRGFVTFEEEETTAVTARVLEVTFESRSLTGCVGVLKEWNVRWGNDGRLVDLPVTWVQCCGHHAPRGLGIDPEMARQVLAERKRLAA